MDTLSLYDSLYKGCFIKYNFQRAIATALDIHLRSERGSYYSEFPKDSLLRAARVTGKLCRLGFGPQCSH